MNNIPRIRSCVAATLLLGLNAVVSLVSASAFNRVTTLDGSIDSPSVSTLVVGEKLFYHQDSGLWVTDGTEEGTLLLLGNTNTLTRTDPDIVSFQGKVYTFFRGNTPNRGLFVTDGTPEGTRRATEIFDGHLSALMVRGNRLVMRDQDQHLVVSDGTPGGTTKYPISTLFGTDSICFIGEDRFYVIGFLREDSNTRLALVFVNNGTLTEIDFSDLPNFPFSPISVQSVSYNDFCFYTTRSKKLVRYDGNMNSRLIDIQSDVGGDTDFSIIGDRLLISALNSRIFSLQGAQFIAEPISLPREAGPGAIAVGVRNVQVRDDQVYLVRDVAIGTDSYGQQVGFVLNEDLEPIAAFDPRTPPFAMEPRHTPLRFGDADLLFLDNGTEVIERRSGDTFLFDINAPNITLTALLANRADADDAIYAIGLDRSRNNQRMLYRFDTSPSFSEFHSGVWTSSTLASQGLTINTGIASDGRSFLFVSLLTYNRGEPLWLIGNTFYANNTTKLQFDLFRFSGPGFLDQDGIPADQTKVGQIELEVMGCSQLAMRLTFSPPFLSQQTVLTRSADQSKNNLCSDP